MNTLIICVITALASFASVWSFVCDDGPGTPSSQVQGAPATQPEIKQVPKLMVIKANLVWGDEFIVSWNNPPTGTHHYSFRAKEGYSTVMEIASTPHTHVNITLKRKSTMFGTKYDFQVNSYNARGKRIHRAHGKIRIPRKFYVSVPLVVQAETPVDEQKDQPQKTVKQFTASWNMRPLLKVSKYKIFIDYFKYTGSEWEKKQTFFKEMVTWEATGSYKFEAKQTGRYDVKVFVVDRAGQKTIGKGVSMFHTEVSPDNMIIKPEDDVFRVRDLELPITIKVEWKNEVKEVAKFMLRAQAAYSMDFNLEEIPLAVSEATFKDKFGGKWMVIVAGFDENGKLICWGQKGFKVEVRSDEMTGFSASNVGMMIALSEAFQSGG